MSSCLQAAVEAQVAAGAPGALARIEAPRAGLTWGGSAGYLAIRARHGEEAIRLAPAHANGDYKELSAKPAPPKK